jgi:hypothetical protein
MVIECRSDEFDGLSEDLEFDNPRVNVPVTDALDPREKLLCRFDSPLGAAGGPDRDRSLARSDHGTSAGKFIKKMLAIGRVRRLLRQAGRN